MKGFIEKFTNWYNIPKLFVLHHTTLCKIQQIIDKNVQTWIYPQSEFQRKQSDRSQTDNAPLIINWSLKIVCTGDSNLVLRLSLASLCISSNKTKLVVESTGSRAFLNLDASSMLQ